MKHALSLLICASLLLAKAVAQPSMLPLKKEYLDSAGHVLPSAAGAAKWRETIYSSDSTRFNSRDYYPSGQLHASVAHRLIRAGRWAGISKGFWEWRLYYPDGRLKRWEREGFLKNRKRCFAPNGQRIPFFAYEMPARYSEGRGDGRAVIEAIKRLAPYPDDARQQQVEGRVFVAFTITQQGTVADIQALRPFIPSAGTAVVQAVRQLKPFIPAQMDGRPVAKRFILPIDFYLP